MNIAYSTDNNYVKYLGISMISLLENNRNLEINIYIIDNGINDKNKELLNNIAKNYNAKITYLDFKALTKNLKTDNTYPVSSYGRIFLSVLNLDKIIYLDCDSIIADSLEDLDNIDISDYYIAGVQDTVTNFFKTSIGLNKDDRYINAGMLVINLKKWREDKIEEKCLQYIDKCKGSVPHHDQGTINAICSSKMLILHPKYNLMTPMFYKAEQNKKLYDMKEYYEQKELDEAIQNPVFIHYTNGFFNRPWNADCTHPLKNIFLKYMNMSPWKGQIEENKLNKNAQIMKKLHKILPFNIYCIFSKIIMKRKERKWKKKIRTH